MAKEGEPILIELGAANRILVTLRLYFFLFPFQSLRFDVVVVVVVAVVVICICLLERCDSFFVAQHCASD